MAPNPFLLAADNDPSLPPFLRATPSLASSQDSHGYSLVHAAASYNHLDLLRLLVLELGAPVDMRDEDGETALFVVETVEAARMLVEELGADITVRSAEGPAFATAREKIEQEDEFPEVAAYLRGVERSRGIVADSDASADASLTTATRETLPEGVAVTVGAMDEEDEVPTEVDPEFRRRIEALAQRDDFGSAEGQAELRRLVEDALGVQAAEERQVRQRTE